MVTYRKYDSVESFANANWERPCIIEKNARILRENGYLRRNMGGSITGASSGYSPYLQAWLCKSGAVIAKLSWGGYTDHGVKEFAKDCGEELA